jgi:hypothetical protein
MCLELWRNQNSVLFYARFCRIIRRPLAILAAGRFDKLFFGEKIGNWM